jgi:methylphosphotriester-DNA--protein-cysteine methyltransferase
MIEETKVSARTFRDAFIKRVGVSAKVFARIVRINTVLEQFKCAPTRQWQDVVFSSGYYDQAHFIKDFKAMTGKSPSLFSDLNLQYIRMLSGR